MHGCVFFRRSAASSALLNTLPASATVSDTPTAEERAKSVSLRYVSDEEPGIRRKGGAKRFSYWTADGKEVRDDKTLARIRALAIPPAWADVWIAAQANGHLQATGRDERGRKQYRYHDRWALTRDETKYGSLVAFAKALPKLRARVESDLRKRSLSRERVIAAVVWLLDNTLIRVGNPAYARDNKSFGLTTLRTRHVEVEGARLRFAFKGKSGKEWRLQLVDRRMARIIRSIQELPGQALFQYFDEDRAKRSVTSSDVNDYIREATDADFSSKHFRTWGGTVHAAILLGTTEAPESQAAQRRVLNRAIDDVAARLGNTRSVCRACYIHPDIFTAWSDGALTEEMLAARRSFRKLADGLDTEEMTVLRWLERRSAKV